MDKGKKAFDFPALKLEPPSEPNATRKYAERWIGKVLLLFSVLGGSSLGVIAN